MNHQLKLSIASEELKTKKLNHEKWLTDNNTLPFIWCKFFAIFLSRKCILSDLWNSKLPPKYLKWISDQDSSNNTLQ